MATPLQYSCLENPHEQRSLVGVQSLGSQRVRHDRANSLSFLSFKKVGGYRSFRRSAELPPLKEEGSQKRRQQNPAACYLNRSIQTSLWPAQAKAERDLRSGSQASET